MKTFWNLISFLAVIHMLALAMFVGWLAMTQRLSAERMESLRELFAPTVAEEQQQRAEVEEQAEAEREAQLEQARLERPPLTSEVQIELSDAIDDKTEQSVRRMQDTKRRLDALLAERERQLDQREARLDERQAQWEESIEAQRRRREDEQFAKAVKTLERLPAGQAKNMLIELTGEGKMEQAVAYIDAMSTYGASKVIRELKAENEIGLAADLLEGLRTFGVEVEGAEDDPDDEPRADLRRFDFDPGGRCALSGVGGEPLGGIAGLRPYGHAAV